MAAKQTQTPPTSEATTTGGVISSASLEDPPVAPLEISGGSDVAEETQTETQQLAAGVNCGGSPPPTLGIADDSPCGWFRGWCEVDSFLPPTVALTKEDLERGAAVVYAGMVVKHQYPAIVQAISDDVLSGEVTVGPCLSCDVLKWSRDQHSSPSQEQLAQLSQAASSALPSLHRFARKIRDYGDRLPAKGREDLVACMAPSQTLYYDVVLAGLYLAENLPPLALGINPCLAQEQLDLSNKYAALLRDHSVLCAYGVPDSYALCSKISGLSRSYFEYVPYHLKSTKALLCWLIEHLATTDLSDGTTSPWELAFAEPLTLPLREACDYLATSSRLGWAQTAGQSSRASGQAEAAKPTATPSWPASQLRSRRSTLSLAVAR